MWHFLICACHPEQNSQCTLLDLYVSSRPKFSAHTSWFMRVIQTKILSAHIIH
jgi:hypothetical protein